MTTIDDVRRLAAADQGLAVVSTIGSDGTPRSSVVNAGVMAHPANDADTVAFVVRGGSHKHRNLHADPRATVVFRSGWDWVGARGRCDLIGPDDAFDGFAQDRVPQLLRDVYAAAGGTHDDWDEYDRVMARERRLAVLLVVERIYSN